MERLNNLPKVTWLNPVSLAAKPQLSATTQDRPPCYKLDLEDKEIWAL